MNDKYRPIGLNSREVYEWDDVIEYMDPYE